MSFLRSASRSRGRTLAYVAAGSALTLGGAYWIYNPSAKIFPPPPPGGRPLPPWTPPTRSEMLASLRASAPVSVLKSQKDLKGDEEFDLLVIGGGATGAGVAVDAASRGLKVALVERDDFSSGTSSKSTKLVHGGVRYLQKAFLELDYEQYKLVREALHERKIFLQTAPYLSHMLPIMLPIYKWWQLPYYWAGCKAYDILAGGENMESSYIMTKGRALEAFPMLKADGLVGALVYYDGQHNDARMNVSLIMTAVQHGATVANHASLIALHKSPSGALSGALVRDRFTGEEIAVRAKGVINATGPFSDALLQLDSITPAGFQGKDLPEDASKNLTAYKNVVAPSSGVHITLPNYYSPRTMGLLDPATSDGRVIFFLPWQGNTIAGTTDRGVDVETDPVAREEEIQWILEEIKRYLSPDIKVRRGDVLAAWSGLRPLIRDPSSPNSKDLVRNHLIHVSPTSNLITIAGGKWTTYRRMAEETVDEAVKVFGFKVGGCVTEEVRLVGSEGWSSNMFIGLVQRYGLETEVAKHLADNYGDRAWAVASMAEASGKRWPLHGVRLNPNYPYIEAEVLYATRVEYAQTAIDVLARRTRLSFLNASAALDVLPRVIELMSAELGWSEKRKEEEWVSARRFLVSMGLPEVGRLPGDADFGRSGRKAFFGDVLGKIAGVVPGIGSAPAPGVNGADAPIHGHEATRAHFSLEELAALKDAYVQRIGGAVDDETKGVTTGELLALVRDDLGYAKEGTGVGDVLSALRSVGVDVGEKADGRTFRFDEVVDVAATFKEAAGQKIMTESASRMLSTTAIPVEKSGGGV